MRKLHLGWIENWIVFTNPHYNFH